jgi:hypothetical protein
MSAGTVSPSGSGMDCDSRSSIGRIGGGLELAAPDGLTVSTWRGTGRVGGEAREDGAEALHDAGVAGAMKVQQHFGLFAELLQRWTRGQPRGGVGHDDLLSSAARVRTSG